MSLIELILPPRILYVKIMMNKLEVKDIQTGKTICRNATKPFSNDRLLIAYFENADNLFQEITKELFGSKTIMRTRHTLLQPVDGKITEITPIEYRIYNDFGQFNGAT